MSIASWHDFLQELYRGYGKKVNDIIFIKVFIQKLIYSFEH